MKTINLKKYVALRESLLKEKATLESRLAEVNAALGAEGSARAAAAAPARGRGRGGAKRAKNKISLKDAVIQVTSGKPLAKADILEAVRKIGYKFSTSDPMNSLNTVLYTGKVFKNTDGKFSPAK
ncbi:MAG: hypothetical protein AB1705_04005 [Verrucomicrobiota bacterium]